MNDNGIARLVAKTKWWTVIWNAYKVGCAGDSVCEELCKYLE